MPTPSVKKKPTLSHEQRDAIFFRERDAQRAADAAKSARLRELRLAKEAQDREAAAQAALNKPVKAVRKAKPRAE
jgi:hypothetical protein